MKNRPVGTREAHDLDKRVARVLRELPPDPPLSLKLVRDLLALDRHYFSLADTGYLQDTISRLRRAGKQVVRRPTLLIDAVRNADLSALWLPDKKRILIDEDIPDLKKRWAEGHEIGHSLTPWHRDYFLGDDRHTLSAECHETLENEANYVNGQLLFLQDRFLDEALSMEPSLATIKSLAKTFGNTQTSTLWRFAEAVYSDRPLVGIVCGHPRYPGADFDPESPCKYVIESRAFREQFGGVSEQEIYRIVQGYASWRKGGPLGATNALLQDANGDFHLFDFETFSNTYEALTLGVYLRARSVHVAVGH